MPGYIGVNPDGDLSTFVAIYDPQGIGADAFDRTNHTGTQPMSSISDAGDLATVNWPASDGDVRAIQDGAFISIKDNLVDGDSL